MDIYEQRYQARRKDEKAKGGERARAASFWFCFHLVVDRPGPQTSPTSTTHTPLRVFRRMQQPAKLGYFAQPRDDTLIRGLPTFAATRPSLTLTRTTHTQQ